VSRSGHLVALMRLRSSASSSSETSMVNGRISMLVTEASFEMSDVREDEEWTRPAPSSLGWAGGGEEVDEQLCDALRLVVMDPMRRVGQAHDAVEVGHIVAVGLG